MDDVMKEVLTKQLLGLRALDVQVASGHLLRSILDAAYASSGGIKGCIRSIEDVLKKEKVVV